MSYIQISKLLPMPLDKAFAALSQPDQLRKAWENEVQVEILGSDQPLKKGAEVNFRMTRFGVSQPLCLVVEEWSPPTLLSLKQVEGPYRFWVQKIKLEQHSETNTLVTESINYALPFGLLGNLADDLFVRSELTRLLRLHLEKLG